MGDHWFTQSHGLEYAEFLQRIARACWSVRGAELDDLTQETYASLLVQHRKDPGKFASKEDVLRYAASSAIHRSWKDGREKKRFAGQGVELSVLPAVSGRENEAAYEKLRELLADCSRTAMLLEKHGPEIREIYFRLCEGETQAEVASALGISAPTVSRRSAHSFSLLRRALEENKDEWGLT